MKRMLLLAGACMCFIANVNAQASGVPEVPKVPTPVSSVTARTYIANYKQNVTNAFAHGYVIDINKARTMSPTGVRVYNALSGSTQQMVMAPLSANYKVNGSGPCFRNSESALCPRRCDVASVDAPVQIPTAEVGGIVNTCMECRKYESVNAFVLFTPTLNALKSAGYNHVRVYNGMDSENKRYVVYVPINAEGAEASIENFFVGDNSTVLTNCKYPN